MTKIEELEKTIVELTPYAITGKLMSIMSHQFAQPLSSLNANIQDLEDAYQADELNSKYLKNSTKHGMSQINELNRLVLLIKELHTNTISSQLIETNIKEIFHEQIRILGLDFSITLEKLDKQYINNNLQIILIAILLNIKEVFSNLNSSKNERFITIFAKNKKIILKMEKNIVEKLKNYNNLPFNIIFLQNIFKKLNVSIKGNEDELIIIFNY